MADNIDLNKKLSISVFCKTCAKVNIHIQPHNNHCTSGHFPFNLIHNDVRNFFIISFKDYNYYIAFEDNYIKFLEIYLMIHKSKMPIKFKEFKIANKIFIHQIHYFRSNNNGKYLHKKLTVFYTEYGIK